jgi:DNA gyrase subunit A
MGRDTRGVRGREIDDEDEVVGMAAIRRPGESILVVSENGYGKRSPLGRGEPDEHGNTDGGYRRTGRGGKGVYTLNTTDKTGPLVALMAVTEHDELMIGTQVGLTIRMRVDDIREMGRATQGVRVINLRDGDAIADVARVSGEAAVEAEATAEPPAVAA